MKEIFTLLFALISVSGLMSQSCLPDGIVFETQAQIDSFQINYPGCMEIEGDVFIYGEDITNLNGLLTITSINGSLIIGDYNHLNINLSDLSGLNNLSTIGVDLIVSNNSNLTSLIGLEAVSNIGNNIAIAGNPVLQSMQGLQSVNNINNIWINYNASLSTLYGLRSLTNLRGWLEIMDNPSLTTLAGLEDLKTINGSLNILNNPSLLSLARLEGLTTVGGSIWIEENEVLTSLIGLGNVTSIGGALDIVNNISLTSLTDLKELDGNSIADLFIQRNISLSKCTVESICLYLTSPNGVVEIYDNAIGCNSPQEVQDSCEAHAGIIDGLSISEKLVIFPNPTHATITIELPTQPSKNTSLTISNTNGQQLITQPITKPQTEIDISHLPVGIYIVKVWNDKDVMVQKVIKQ